MAMWGSQPRRTREPFFHGQTFDGGIIQKDCVPSARSAALKSNEPAAESDERARS
jgi:hypothetical protein